MSRRRVGDEEKKGKAPEKPAFPTKQGMVEKVDWAKRLLGVREKERLEAIKYACDSKDPEAIPALLKLFEDMSGHFTDLTFRAAATIPLIGIDEDLHKKLVGMLDSPSPGVRTGAALALGIAAEERNVPYLVTTAQIAIQNDLETFFEETGEALIYALMVCAKSGYGHALDIAREGDIRMKEFVVGVINNEGDTHEEIDELVALLDDKDPELALAAGKALGNIRGWPDEENIKKMETMFSEGTIDACKAVTEAISGADPDTYLEFFMDYIMVHDNEKQQLALRTLWSGICLMKEDMKGYVDILGRLTGRVHKDQRTAMRAMVGIGYWASVDMKDPLDGSEIIPEGQITKAVDEFMEHIGRNPSIEDRRIAALALVSRVSILVEKHIQAQPNKS